MPSVQIARAQERERGMGFFGIDAPPQWWVRRAAPLLTVASLVLVAACSGGSAERIGTTAQPVAATPELTVTAEVTVRPETTPVLITSVDYLALFNKVSAGTVESVGVLNQIALIVTTNDEVRGDLGADVQLLIGSIELQLDVLEDVEPVPPDMTEAHQALKTALLRYIDAAMLLLPPDQGGPDGFDFFTFQPLVQEGGENFHGAGAALP
jgi:hypothetical protein